MVVIQGRGKELQLGEFEMTKAEINVLMTSLEEIESFHPCIDGWRRITEQREGKVGKFPLVDCLIGCEIGDVCWLLGKRKKEIAICIDFARKCADSVKNFSFAAAGAAAGAAYDAAAAYAAAYAAADAAYDAAAGAAAGAAYAAAADAAAAGAAAGARQEEKNKQFLREAIIAFESKAENN